MNIFISIISTASIYMIFPFIFLFKRTEKYSNKKINILLIFNSATIKFIMILIEYEIFNNINTVITPAILYFFINQAIWCKNKKVKQKVDNATNNNNTIIEQNKLDKNYKKEKVQKQNSLKSTIIYTILIISIFINIFLFSALILVSNNLNSTQQEFDEYKIEKAQTCKYHMQLTENGPINVCN